MCRKEVETYSEPLIFKSPLQLLVFSDFCDKDQIRLWN